MEFVRGIGRCGLDIKLQYFRKKLLEIVNH